MGTEPYSCHQHLNSPENINTLSSPAMMKINSRVVSSNCSNLSTIRLHRKSSTRPSFHHLIIATDMEYEC